MINEIDYKLLWLLTDITRLKAQLKLLRSCHDFPRETVKEFRAELKQKLQAHRDEVAQIRRNLKNEK